ncbi:MAG: alpha/beta hydrolase [Acidobacteria bacterium]|nr:alpha/beta hydrolase [Acidobacteriota bacterium]
MILPLLVMSAALAAEIPDSVAVQRDIVYATYGEKQLRLDLYRPKSKSSQSIPGIIVIRGGGWRSGDKNGFGAIAAGLAERGFAAASIEYRVLPEFTLNDCVNDVKAAVRWMRAEAKTYHINPDAIGAIGGSAGGHLAALLGASAKATDLDGPGGHANTSSRVQAVVAMAGVFDFSAMPGRSNEFPAKLAPLTHLGKDAPPFLLIHSDADKTVPIAQSQQMLDRCRRQGTKAELITINGAPHAFWNMPTWHKETIEHAARFFHAVLAP